MMFEKIKEPKQYQCCIFRISFELEVSQKTSSTILHVLAYGATHATYYISIPNGKWNGR